MTVPAAAAAEAAATEPRAAGHIAGGHIPGEHIPGEHIPGEHIPGEPGLWVVIFGDLVIFSLFFVVYMLAYVHARGVFESSQRLLDRRLGLLNTLLLLTSSWFVARAVDAVRTGSHRARGLVTCGMLCGVGFIVVKAFEYHAKFSAGITISSGPFFVYYFMFTGIHLFHVVIGLGVLLLVRSRFDKNGRWTGSVGLLEGGAAYWHLVDLLWLVLFAILYLI